MSARGLQVVAAATGEREMRVVAAAMSARELQVVAAAAADMEEKRSCGGGQQSCGEGQQSRRVALKGNNRAEQKRSCGGGQQMRMTAELKVAVRKSQQCSGQLR